MTVVTDLIESHVVRQTSAGLACDRVFLVNDLTGKPEARVYNVLNLPDIPKFGDGHPSIPDVVVTDIQVSPLSKESTKAKVRVTYSEPAAGDDAIDPEKDETSPGTVSVNTSLTNEQTFLDINGDFMIVKWSGTSQKTKYVAADVQRPQLQVSFTRDETAVPKAAIDGILGRVNGVPWSGFPAKTWLCTQIDAREEKPDVFNVTYGFSYNPNTWRVESTIALNAAEIEELPPDVDSGNGYGRFDVYRVADFNSLGLSF